MYVVTEATLRYVVPDVGQTVAYDRTTEWLVIDDSTNPDTPIARCWTQSDAELIASALNGA